MRCDFVLLWREHASRRLHTTIRSMLFVQLSTRLERDWVLARGRVHPRRVHLKGARACVCSGLLYVLCCLVCVSHVVSRLADSVATAPGVTSSVTWREAKSKTLGGAGLLRAIHV